MKIKIEGCLSAFIILAMVAFGLFLTYLFALGIITFVDKFRKPVYIEKVTVVDTVKVNSQFETVWDKNIPLTDDAI